MAVAPFGNMVDIISLRGRYLLEALEHSVASYDIVDPPGRFLQFSGMLIDPWIQLLRTLSAQVYPGP